MNRKEILASLDRIMSSYYGRQYGRGLVSSPAQFGYGNIGGCDMYGGGGKRKASDWQNPKYGLRERSKLLNRHLNNLLWEYGFSGRQRTDQKLKLLLSYRNERVIDDQQYDYMVKKIKTGIQQYPVMLHTICDPANKYYDPQYVPPPKKVREHKPKRIPKKRKATPTRRLNLSASDLVF